MFVVIVEVSGGLERCVHSSPLQIGLLGRLELIPRGSDVSFDSDLVLLPNMLFLLPIKEIKVESFVTR